MMDCIFCKIVNGEIPAQKVYENSSTIAFLDIRPISRGHTLVIPKLHAQNLFELSDEALATTMSAVKKIAIALRKMADGINIGMNNERVAGQVVDHAHVHVIPRYHNDGLKHWPGKDLLPEDATKIAAEIKTLL